MFSIGIGPNCLESTKGSRFILRFAIYCYSELPEEWGLSPSTQIWSSGIVIEFIIRRQKTSSPPIFVILFTIRPGSSGSDAIIIDPTWDNLFVDIYWRPVNSPVVFQLISDQLQNLYPSDVIDGIKIVQSRIVRWNIVHGH